MRTSLLSFRRCEYAADVCSSAVQSNHSLDPYASASRTEARFQCYCLTAARSQRHSRSNEILHNKTKLIDHHVHRDETHDKSKPLVTDLHGHSDEAKLFQTGVGGREKEPNRSQWTSICTNKGRNRLESQNGTKPVH